MGRLPRLLRRPLVAGAALVVLGAAGGGAYWLTRDSGSKDRGQRYRLVPAGLATIRQALSSTGTIEPAEQEELNFSVSGKVTSVRAQEGDHVKRRQCAGHCRLGPAARESRTGAGDAG